MTIWFPVALTFPGAFRGVLWIQIHKLTHKPTRVTHKVVSMEAGWKPIYMNLNMKKKRTEKKESGIKLLLISMHGDSFERRSLKLISVAGLYIIYSLKRSESH